ncbi:hypothetical protein BH11VER1_BH11VER1_07850 [soil metagenome]
MALNHTDIIRTLFAARCRLLAAAWLVVRDSHLTEDIFQSLSIKALDDGLVFEHESALISWAHVVVKREGLQWLRKHKRETVGLEDDVLNLMEGEWAQEQAGRTSLEAEALSECLVSMPQNSRRLLELRYFEGRDCTEVAKSLGCGLDAVYKRLSRLHGALKECIEHRLNIEAAHG